MAKENQDTVGEVDELPVSDAETEAENATGATVAETNLDDADERTEADGLQALEDDEAPSQDPEPDAVVSAPPSLALWLSDELRPSPSKSAPPMAPASVDHPETLAPVAVPQAELSDEDLAVLPPGSRPGESRSLRTAVIVLLGAAAAVFLFSYSRSPATAPQPHTEPAAQPVAADPVDRGSAPPPARVTDVAPPSESTSDEPAARRLGHGRWVPPTSDDETALDEEARLRGPSVGRFPDLPAEYWSELRRRDRESKAERQRQLAEEAFQQ